MIQLVQVVIRVRVAGLTDAGVAVTTAVNIVLGHSARNHLTACNPQLARTV